MNPYTVSDILRKKLLQFYKPEEFPAVFAQAEIWRHCDFLRRKKIFDATPVFRNTLAKYSALLSAGADLTIGYSDLFPYDPETVSYLESLGIRVRKNDFSGDEEYDVVLDCAGLHRTKNSRYGFVELTRSGVAKFADCPKPVYLADSSRIKEIETCLGTGDGCIRALRHYGYANLEERKILLFGYGKVGRGIAMYLADAGAHVTVVDDLSRVVPAEGLFAIDLHSTEQIREAIFSCWCVVTATGKAGIMKSYAEALIKTSALLINMGAEDEFGSLIPCARVLNEKKPFNFILEEPTHMKYIDPTMALHNEGARILLTEHHGAGAFTPSEETEKEILERVRKANLIQTEIEKAGV